MELVVLRGDPELLTEPERLPPLDAGPLAAALRAEPELEDLGDGEYHWSLPGAEVDLWVGERERAPYAVFVDAGIIGDRTADVAVVMLARRLANAASGRVWSQADERFL